MSSGKGPPKYEKMSKSRGNVVLPEEVVYGVCEVMAGWEFRGPPDGGAIDPVKLGVWRDPVSGLYYTATRHGRQPAFLCMKGEPIPPLLVFGGQEITQHPDFMPFWLPLLIEFDPEVREAYEKANEPLRPGPD